MKSFSQQSSSLFTSVLVILSWTAVTCTILQTEYMETPLCNAQERIDNACFMQVPTISRIGCFTLCSMNASCRGVLIPSSDTTCYHETACSFTPTCTTSDPNFRFYMNQADLVFTTEAPETTQSPGCQHGGTENLSTGECDCSQTGGYIGQNCETLGNRCSQLSADGYPNGEYSVQLDFYGDGSYLFATYCQLSMFSSHFEVMRNSGSFDTTLTWNDYVNGFHLGPNDFFIGLEHLHRYTSDGGSHSVGTIIKFYSSTVTATYSKYFRDFVVASAASGYSYTVGNVYSSGGSASTSGGGSSAGMGLDDCLSSQENTPFSTSDNDEDGSGAQNCAQVAEAGWWFDGCSPFKSNPFGWSYASKPGPTTDSHFHVPGVDMSRASVKEAFHYFALVFDI